MVLVLRPRRKAAQTPHQFSTTNLITKLTSQHAVRWAYIQALQRRHMGAANYQITGTYTVCLTVCSWQHIKTPLVIGGSPHKETVKWRSFPCHDVIVVLEFRNFWNGSLTLLIIILIYFVENTIEKYVCQAETKACIFIYWFTMIPNRLCSYLSLINNHVNSIKLTDEDTYADYQANIIHKMGKLRLRIYIYISKI